MTIPQNKIYLDKDSCAIVSVPTDYNLIIVREDTNNGAELKCEVETPENTQRTMKTNYIQYWLIFGTLIVCCCQCHKAPEPIKPDPCANKTASGADFYVYETFNFDKSSLWVDYDTDTAVTGAVYFQAKDKKADSYRWEVGAGVYTTSGFTVSFYDEKKVLNIPVKLTLVKKGDTTCFKTQNGIYTKTRNITIIHPTLNVYAFKNGCYFGSYKGSDGLSDTITVYLNLDETRNPEAQYGKGGSYGYSDLFRSGVRFVGSDITGYRQLCMGPGDYNSGPQTLTPIYGSYGSVRFAYFNNVLTFRQSASKVVDRKTIYRTFTGTYLTKQPK